MRLLYCGDIVGRAGRDAVIDRLPELRAALALDFVVANGENAAHGFGITAKICGQLFDAGVDVITSGNHIWDQREILHHIDHEPRLLRPCNLAEDMPGRGVGIFVGANGRRLAVVNVMGALFMQPVEEPFQALEAALDRYPLGDAADAVLVDIHAEATSEKMAVGHVCDGRASLVVGSHSHVPTADCRILPGGTAYQTDAGMCGDYDSVIGMEKSGSLARFHGRENAPRLEPATGEGTLCAVFVEIDDATGLARRAAPVRQGGDLAEEWPLRED
ncbi:MAG: TIGR00282 family metallophosphoesterase [Alphaproteobacteria bacterium]